MPRDHFDLVRRTDDDRPASVRPRVYLRSMRLPGYDSKGSLRALSAGDHVVLEALLTAYVQTGSTRPIGMLSVPYASILRLLPGRRKPADLVASLERLKLSRIELKDRRIREDLRPVLRPGFDEQGLLEPSDYVAPPRGRQTPIPTRQSRDAALGRPVRPVWKHDLRVIKAASNPKLRPLVGIEPVEHVRWPVADENGYVHVPPVLRYLIREKDLIVELSPYLQAYLIKAGPPDRTHVGYWQGQYLHLDLGRMGGFTSGYTPPLYRHLVDVVGFIRRPTTRTMTMSFEEMAETICFRIQKTGSLRAHLEKPLESCRKDFAVDQSGLDIQLRWRGDDGAFLDHVEISLNSPLPPLRRLPSRRMGEYTANSIKGRTRHKPLDQQTRYMISRSDAPELQVGLSAWSKIYGLLGCELNDLMLYSEAFDFALDEALRCEDPGFHPYPGRYRDHPYRGPRLMDAIRREGVGRACTLFCLAEFDRPDLSDRWTRLELTARQVTRHVLADRRARQDAAKIVLPDGSHPIPTRVNRGSRAEGCADADEMARRGRELAQSIAAVRELRRQSLERKAAEEVERAEAKAARKERKRIERNALRVCRYHEAKLGIVWEKEHAPGTKGWWKERAKLIEEGKRETEESFAAWKETDRGKAVMALNARGRQREAAKRGKPLHEQLADQRARAALRAQEMETPSDTSSWRSRLDAAQAEREAAQRERLAVNEEIASGSGSPNQDLIIDMPDDDFDAFAGVETADLDAIPF